MISHERYAELLSKHINRTITDSEQKDITKFEAAQPQTCPKCHNAVWSPFPPPRVVHDIAKCDAKPTPFA